MFREVNLISLLFLFPLDLSSSRRQSFTRRAVAAMLPTGFFRFCREAVEYEILTQ